MTQSNGLAKKNTPYWWEAAPVGPTPEQPIDTELDVAIVGAGYTGLAAALHLARQGRKVAVFDAMNPGRGASTVNGGMASASIRPGFAELTRRYGEKTAIAIEVEGKTAREFLREFIHDEGLDCDFRLTGSFRGALGFNQYSTMARDADAVAKRLGIDSYAVPFAEQQEYVGSDFYRGGIVRMDVGGLHPAKFHAELLRVAQESGATVHANKPVTGIRRDGKRFEVAVAGETIRANQVLVCTNGYTNGFAPFLRRRLVPVRSRMIATEALPADLMARLMPRGMMLSENRQLGYYYRPSPDGSRILLGGRDSSRRGNPAEPTIRLRNGLVELFPELQDVRLTHSWFGNVAMNRDMLPRLFEKDGVVYACGFCGSGVVWAPWLGTRAANRLLGNDKAASTAFHSRPPAMIPLYRGDPWFMPAIIKGYALQDKIEMWRMQR